MTTAAQVVSAVVNLGAAALAASLQVPDSLTRSRDLSNTPTLLSAGDCPMLIHDLAQPQNQRMAFGDTDGSAKRRKDYEITVYYIDQAENLSQIWDTRPRAIAFVDTYIDMIGAHDTLNGTVSYASAASAGAQDEARLRYNGIPFRGAIIKIKAFQFV